MLGMKISRIPSGLHAQHENWGIGKTRGPGNEVDQIHGILRSIWHEAKIIMPLQRDFP